MIILKHEHNGPKIAKIMPKIADVGIFASYKCPWSCALLPAIVGSYASSDKAS